MSNADAEERRFKIGHNFRMARENADSDEGARL
jgi:hypothetical protein